MTDESLFASALALPAPDRADYLERACAGNPALRREVEALAGLEVLRELRDRTRAQLQRAESGLQLLRRLAGAGLSSLRTRVIQRWGFDEAASPVLAGRVPARLVFDLR